MMCYLLNDSQVQRLGMFVVEKVPLNEVCSAVDICKDDHAECHTGLCLCLPTHYEVDGKCGKCTYCCDIGWFCDHLCLADVFSCVMFCSLWCRTL